MGQTERSPVAPSHAEQLTIASDALTLQRVLQVFNWNASSVPTQVVPQALHDISATGDDRLIYGRILLQLCQAACSRPLQRGAQVTPEKSLEELLAADKASLAKSKGHKSLNTFWAPSHALITQFK